MQALKLRGPRGLPLVGNLLSYVRGPLRFLTNAARDYGDVVRLRLPGPPTILITHPDDIENVLVTNQHNFAKDRVLQCLSAVIGNGLLLSEGAYWRQQHSIIQPDFQRNNMGKHIEFVSQYADTLIGHWPVARPVDLFEEASRISLAALGHILFDNDLGTEHSIVLASLDAVMKHFLGIGGTGFRIPAGVPTAENRRFKRALRELDTAIARLMNAGLEIQGGLLWRLSNHIDDDGNRLTAVAIRDELVTLLLTGSETTALAATYACHLIAGSPLVRARMQDELDTVLAGQQPDTAALRSLKYTNWVILEAMRLYPPAWAIGREALSDCSIGGHGIPRDSQIIISQWVTQRDERWFDAPSRFHPQRWAGDFQKSLPRFAYFPFGGGKRTCIGNHLAMMEVTVIIATIMQRFNLEPCRSKKLQLQATVTLRPRQALRFIAKRRGALADRSKQVAG